MHEHFGPIWRSAGLFDWDIYAGWAVDLFIHTSGKKFYVCSSKS